MMLERGPSHIPRQPSGVLDLLARPGVARAKPPLADLLAASMPPTLQEALADSLGVEPSTYVEEPEIDLDQNLADDKEVEPAPAAACDGPEPRRESASPLPPFEEALASLEAMAGEGLAKVKQSTDAEDEDGEPDPASARQWSRRARDRSYRVYRRDNAHSKSEVTRLKPRSMSKSYAPDAARWLPAAVMEQTKASLRAAGMRSRAWR
jgi:hypothetical protein